MTFITDVYDLQIPSTIVLSPSSQQVVYATTHPLNHKLADAEHEVSTLWLADVGEPGSARQITSGRFNDRDPKWSPDGRSIAFVSDRAKAGEKWAIYVLPVDQPGEALAITDVESERGVSKYEFSPDGKMIAFLSADEKPEEQKKREKEKDDAQVWGEDWEYERLRLLNLETKEVEVLVEKNVHVTDVAWSDKGKSLAYITTERPYLESPYQFGTHIWTMNLVRKNEKRLARFPAGAHDLVWKGDSLYFIGPIAENISTSASCVFSLPADDSHTLKASVKNKGEGSYTHHSHGISTGAEGLQKTWSNEIMIFVQEGMHDQVRLLDNPDRIIYSEKRKLNAWSAIFAKDSDEIILSVAWGSPNKPVEVYSTTTSGGASVQLSSHGVKFTETYADLCSKAEFLTCKSTDGEVELEGFVLLPAGVELEDKAGKPLKPLPTVVMIHGGPYYRHTVSFDHLYFGWSSLVLKAGYACLVVDYRGSSARGEEWATQARGTGVKDYADVIALTNAAIEQGWSDKDRLVVGGWSQGGFLSYLSAVRNGTHGLGWDFKAAIPGAGITEADTMALTSDIGFWEAELTVSGSPWHTRDPFDSRNRAASALWEIGGAVDKGVKIPPMLILHGEKDPRVPIEQARGMRRALEYWDGKGKAFEFEYVVYPREPHGISERRHLIDMGERVVRWVEKWIGKGVVGGVGEEA